VRSSKAVRELDANLESEFYVVGGERHKRVRRRGMDRAYLAERKQIDGDKRRTTRAPSTGR
jgi:hypothetical protein